VATGRHLQRIRVDVSFFLMQQVLQSCVMTKRNFIVANGLKLNGLKAILKKMEIEMFISRWFDQVKLILAAVSLV
jgi:hypothetical protein